jgi:hypothetical protein
VRIFGRRVQRQEREDDEYSQKARSRGCIDLIDDDRKERKERRYIHGRPSLGPTIFNRLLNP